MGDFDNMTDSDGPIADMLYDDAGGNTTAQVRVSIVAMVFLPIVIFVGIFGNTMVCIAVVRIHKLRTVANSFVVSLAISDLAVCIIVLPLGLYEAVNIGSWYLGDVLCNTWLSLDILLSTASVWNLLAIAGDRWLAITKPIWYANRRSATLAGAAMAVAWGVPVLITLPSMVIMNLRDREGVPTCYLNVDLSYIIAAAIIAFFIPCILVLGVYVCIFFAVREHFLRKPSNIRNRKKSSSCPTTDRSMDSLPDSSGNAGVNGKTEYTVAGSMGSINAINNPARKISTSASIENSTEFLDRPPLKRRTSRIPRISVSREKKAAIVLSIVVGAFIVCWLPYFTCVLIYSASGGAILPSDETWVAFSWLGWINSIVNPIIYTIFNKDFRKAFRYILQCQCDNWISQRTSSSR